MKRNTRLTAAPRRLLALMLTLCMLLGVGSALPAAADKRSELEAKLERLEAQEKEIKKNLAAANKDLSASQYRKNQLDAQIDNVVEQLDLLDSQLKAINSNIAAKEAEIKAAQTAIAEKEAAIEATHTQLGLRLRAIAKSGNVSALQRLLNTDNYTDYLLKSKAAECIARRDQQTMDELEAALEEIRQQKVALEAEKKELFADQSDLKKLKTSSDAKKRQLDDLCAAAQTEVRNLQSSVNGYGSQLKAKQKEIEAADKAIEELIKNTASTGRYNQDMMFWPVPTVRNISSGFGPRWGTMHRGIDISEGAIPIYGENIVAAADGTVIAVNYTSTWGSGWSAGYGYCVLIDHGLDSQGRKITTMYAHASKMFARVGQKVVGGKTVLAQAGKTGDVTGPHLHFEVRVDGIRVNPYPKYVSPNVN